MRKGKGKNKGQSQYPAQRRYKKYAQSQETPKSKIRKSLENSKRISLKKQEIKYKKSKTKNEKSELGDEKSKRKLRMQK